MKNFFLSLIVLMFCGSIQVNAQSEQSFKPSVLQINEGGKTYNYVLRNFSYSIYRVDSDSIPFEKQSLYVSLNFTINSPSDDVITKWITDPAAVRKGKILFKNKDDGTVLKEFSFEEAYVSNSSESLYDSGYGESEPNLSLGIVCEKFSIGNTPVKNITLRSSY